MRRLLGDLVSTFLVLVEVDCVSFAGGALRVGWSSTSISDWQAHSNRTANLRLTLDWNSARGLAGYAGGDALRVHSCLAEAQARAYGLVDRIDWPDGFCRRDIGWRAL